jgi:hypothetical protein
MKKKKITCKIYIADEKEIWKSEKVDEILTNLISCDHDN